MVVRGLLRFRNRHRPDDADEAHMEGETAHAWWADRDEVSQKPNPKLHGANARRAAAPPNSTEPGFKQYYTNASLYEHNQPIEVDPVEEALILLGVAATSDWKQINLAYRQKAKECHPDRRAGDDSDMIEVNQAYAVLRRHHGK